MWWRQRPAKAWKWRLKFVKRTDQTGPDVRILHSLIDRCFVEIADVRGSMESRKLAGRSSRACCYEVNEIWKPKSFPFYKTLLPSSLVWFSTVLPASQDHKRKTGTPR